MVLLRRVIGDTLRQQRLAQHRTLREVSTAAKVSLGYLSEVERGQKEPSSELLSSICDALGVRLSQVLRDVSDTLDVVEAVETPSTESPVLGTVVPDDASELETLGGAAASRIDTPRGLDARASAHHRVVAAA